MTTIRERFRRWFAGRPTPSTRLSPHAASLLARQLEATEELEFDCDQVHQLMDQFAEAVQRGEKAADWVPLIRDHLDKCTDCLQEFEALLRVLQATGT